jgi:hypothetical protein
MFCVAQFPVRLAHPAGRIAPITTFRENLNRESSVLFFGILKKKEGRF